MSAHVSPPSPTSPEPAVAAAEWAAGAAATTVGAAPATASSPVDARRWPDVARPPRASWPRTAIAERVVRHALARPALRARDGSTAGPEGAPVVVLRSRRALRRLVRQPDELGLAQAYVTGELDIDGDLTDGLRTVRGAARERGPRPPKLTLADRARAVATMVRLGAVGPRPPVPSSQAGLGGAPHSKARDRAAISHHYDLSDDSFEERRMGVDQIPAVRPSDELLR
ncbi:hypothetical protein SSPS47_05575 [Streptomyces sp. S4.7]|nr:hypothetical protein SSPS47_05575 [Streptomyces sp. S4.7]